MFFTFWYEIHNESTYLNLLMEVGYLIANQEDKIMMMAR